MLKPGDTLDHYVVEALIGGGGMARVYRVRHKILDHPMALKVLDRTLVTKERIRKRFLAEGRIMAKVRHPAIVMVTDAVIDPRRGVAGLVMEYVEGPDLARVIERMQGPPSADFVRRVMLPVLDGLHHVHQEGVVHRDIKPANLLLSRDAAGTWYPRITDFGVAWLAPEASARAGRPPTLEGGLVGTPAYMAPEQARGERPSPAWDVWAAGVMLYELATGGHQPFERGEQSATLAAVREGAYEDPERIHGDLDPAIAATIRAALHKDPRQRGSSTAELASLLAGGRTGHGDDLDYELSEAAGAWLESPDGARRLPLAEGVVLGRGPGADVVLRDTGVEPLHARILRDGAAWHIEDLSTGGTHLNGARIRTMRLADGDLLRIGWASWRVRLGPSAPEPEPEPPRSRPEADRYPTTEAAGAVPLAGARTYPALVLPGGQRVFVGLQPVVIGRSPAAELRLEDQAVSVRHARVHLQGRDVLIEDLLSANGTWVNGQRARFRRLQGGDMVKVGHTELRLELGPGDAPA